MKVVRFKKLIRQVAWEYRKSAGCHLLMYDRPGPWFEFYLLFLSSDLLLTWPRSSISLRYICQYSKGGRLKYYNHVVPFDRKYFLVNFCYQFSRSRRYPCRLQPSGAGRGDGKCSVGAGAVAGADKQNGVATRPRWFTANYTAFKGKLKPKYWITASSSTNWHFSFSLKRFVFEFCFQHCMRLPFLVSNYVSCWAASVITFIHPIAFLFNVFLVVLFLPRKLFVIGKNSQIRSPVSKKTPVQNPMSISSPTVQGFVRPCPFAGPTA